MTEPLKFYAYERAPMLKLAGNRQDGRLSGRLPLTLTDTAHPVRTTAGSAQFVFYGAKDVAGLKQGAIRLVAPRPDVNDAETTKLVHVDFADADLPWRYPSFIPIDHERRPWLVVVAGLSESIRVAGNAGTVAAKVLQAHPLAQSALWAHVQEDNGAFTSRIVSPFKLAPQSDYTAAIVPAFNWNGDPSWTADGELTDPSRPSLPIFYSWRFATAEEGDFETLAAALRVRRSGDLGKARVAYHRPITDVEVDLAVGGAITSLQQPLETVDPTAMDDRGLTLALRDVSELMGGIDPGTLTTEEKRQRLTELRDVARADIDKARLDLDGLSTDVTDTYFGPDELKREIVEMPSYGRPWAPDPEAMVWGNTLNDDPRNRGVAGLGLWMAILAQEELMAAAVEQAGALGLASQRAGDLALGLAAAGSLWNRLLPDDPAHQLRAFGPAMGRMLAASGGSVLERVTGGDTHLDVAVFSSAAQRILRDGTGPSRHLTDRRIDLGAAMAEANRGPESQTGPTAGSPHLDRFAAELEGRTFNELIGVDRWPDEVWDVVERFSGQPLEDGLIEAFVSALRDVGLGCDDFVTSALRDAKHDFGAKIATCELLVASVQRCIVAMSGNAHLEGAMPVFISELIAPPCPSHGVPIDLGALAAAVGGVIDPTVECPPAARRLNSTIDGLHVCPPRPPELPVRLDFPTWTLLNTYAKEWLLPGAGTLPQHSIVALQTNPTFIDAYMVGINTQFMNEMRWRGLAVDRSITPLRMFWGQMNYQTNRRGPDIQPIADWTSKPEADLGASSHQVIKPGDPTDRRDLIILLRTPLFRRYPSTVVYLVNKNAGTADQVKEMLKKTPLFTHEPGVERPDRTFHGPIFRGALEPDLHFFAFDVDPGTLDGYWLVLDEPPAELRFRVDRPDGPDSATTAKLRIDHPTRVAIDGKSLEDLALQ